MRGGQGHGFKGLLLAQGSQGLPSLCHEDKSSFTVSNGSRGAGVGGGARMEKGRGVLCPFGGLTRLLQAPGA